MESSYTGSQPHILIVDDEKNTNSVLTRAFDLLGYNAESAQSGEAALELLKNNDYDLMLLDLKMPGIDGVSVMKQISKTKPSLLVIVLTAHATLDSAIEAIKAGAVDYLLKPQSIANIQEAVKNALSKKFEEKNRQELIDQIVNAANKLKNDPEVEIYDGQRLAQGNLDYRLDIEKRYFVYQDPDTARLEEISLTDHEFAILSYLIKNKGEVFSHQTLAENALGYKNITAREAQLLISPHIARIRKKIERDSVTPFFIKTIRGKGYIFSK